MKKYSVLLFFAVSLFFVGCTMEKRHYNSGYHVEWLSQKGKVNKAEPAAQPEKEVEQQLAMQEEPKVAEQEAAVVAPVMTTEVVAPVTVKENVATPAKQTTSKAPSKQEVRKEMKAAQKEMKSIEKGFTADASVATLDQTSSSPFSDVPVILLVILAIILPPLAVFLHRGIGTEFWISLILTLLVWVPGVIYALLVVLDVI